MKSTHRNVRRAITILALVLPVREMQTVTHLEPVLRGRETEKDSYAYSAEEEAGEDDRDPVARRALGSVPSFLV